MVADPALVERGVDTDAEGQDDGDEGGQDHHPQGDQEMAGELGAHALAVDGQTEVAADGVGEPEPVALGQRVVEMEKMLPGDDRGVGDLGIGPQQGQRVAGLGNQEEDHDGCQKQHDDADDQAPQNVGDHQSVTSPGGWMLTQGGRPWPTPLRSSCIRCWYCYDFRPQTWAFHGIPMLEVLGIRLPKPLDQAKYCGFW